MNIEGNNPVLENKSENDPGNQERKRSEEQKEVAELFRPLTEGMMSEIGTERVNKEPKFRSISYSFA